MQSLPTETRNIHDNMWWRDIFRFTPISQNTKHTDRQQPASKHVQGCRFVVLVDMLNSLSCSRGYFWDVFMMLQVWSLAETHFFPCDQVVTCQKGAKKPIFDLCCYKIYGWKLFFLIQRIKESTNKIKLKCIILLGTQLSDKKISATHFTSQWS